MTRSPASELSAGSPTTFRTCTAAAAAAIHSRARRKREKIEALLSLLGGLMEKEKKKKKKKPGRNWEKIKVWTPTAVSLRFVNAPRGIGTRISLNH